MKTVPCCRQHTNYATYNNNTTWSMLPSLPTLINHNVTQV